MTAWNNSFLKTCLIFFFTSLLLTNCQKKDDVTPPSKETADQHQETVLGANFNENVTEINPGQVVNSKMEWVRTFINITKFLKFDENGNITGIRQQFLDEYNEVSFLKEVTKHNIDGKDIKIILSLKFNFKLNNMGVPEMDSPVIQHLTAITEAILNKSNIAEDIDILVVGNEPMWETPNNDVEKLGKFMDLLITNLDTWKNDNEKWNYQIYTGALNRASELQLNNPILKKVFYIAKHNAKVEGLDLHTHIRSIEEAKGDVAWVRAQGFKKELIVTEFSLHRLLQSKTTTALGAWGVENGYSYDMEVWQWLNELIATAGTDPIPPKTFKSFFDAQPWYPQNWFSTFYEAYQQHDVKVATYGFLRTADPSFQLDSNSPAWMINAYLNEALLGKDEQGNIIRNPLIANEVEQIVEQGTK